MLTKAAFDQNKNSNIVKYYYNQIKHLNFYYYFSIITIKSNILNVFTAILISVMHPCWIKKKN